MLNRVASPSFPTALLLFALAVPAGPRALAEDAPAPERISMSFAAETQVEEILKAAASAGLPLQWNPGDKQIRGRQISAPLRIATDAKGLLSRLRAVLVFYELVIVPTGPQSDPTYFVMDARQPSVLMRLKPETVEVTAENVESLKSEDGRYVTTTIRPRNISDMRALRNMVSRILTMNNIGSAVEVPESNALMVTDFAPVVAVIWETVKEMDVLPGASGSDGRTEAIALEHADAAVLAAVLESHFLPKPSAPTGPVRATQSSVEQPAPPRISADMRTNQILASGSPRDLDQIRAAIKLLDVPVKREPLEVRIVPLAHAAAPDVAGLLSQMAARGGQLWRDGDGQLPTFVGDPRTNSLVVSCTARHWKEVAATIASLDVVVSEAK